MKFSGKTRGRSVGLQLTAMMDVIFLLLCFFVTSSVFSQWESEISVSLPTAQSGAVPGRMPGEIIVNVSADGRIGVNGQSLTRDDLGTRLKRIAALYPGQPVIVRADRSTKYDDIVGVIDTCRLADVWNISFAVKSEEGDVP